MIHFCREGRIEQEINREFFYLMPGDCSIAMGAGGETMFRLPLKHYHGISIRIDLDSDENPLLAYSKVCGMHSEAEGLVLSLPIDSVMGV